MLMLARMASGWSPAALIIGPSSACREAYICHPFPSIAAVELDADAGIVPITP